MRGYSDGRLRYCSRVVRMMRSFSDLLLGITGRVSLGMKETMPIDQQV